MKNFMKALLISGSIAALANMAAYAAEKVGQSSDKAACQGTQVGKVGANRVLPVDADQEANKASGKVNAAKNKIPAPQPAAPANN